MKNVGKNNTLKTGKKWFVFITVALIALMSFNTYYTQQVIDQSIHSSFAVIER